MTARGSERGFDFYDTEHHDYTIRVHEEDERVSPVLGPNGHPFVYPKRPVGFDLRPRKGSLG